MDKESQSCRGGLELLFGNVKEAEVDIPADKGRVRPFAFFCKLKMIVLHAKEFLVLEGRATILSLLHFANARHI